MRLHFPLTPAFPLPSASGNHAPWKHITWSYLISQAICIRCLRTYCAPSAEEISNGTACYHVKIRLAGHISGLWGDLNFLEDQQDVLNLTLVLQGLHREQCAMCKLYIKTKTDRVTDVLPQLRSDQKPLLHLAPGKGFFLWPPGRAWD